MREDRVRVLSPRNGRKSFVVLAGLTLLSLGMLFALACDANDIPTISAGELKELLSSDTQVLVVDTRTEAEYVRGHLPKAILIPDEKASFADRLLPENTDKEKTTIIFYCRGGG